MIDREKVLNGLECCSKSIGKACPLECPYRDECMMQDDGLHMYSVIHDALELLKQEEEVPVKRCRVHPNARYPFSCGNCGSYLMPNWIACPMCGREAKWDG